MSSIYYNHKVWLTIDIEEITDTNFNIRWKCSSDLKYEKLIESWIELNNRLGYKSTCFVLGSFATKYPNLIKKLYDNGHEIASHGINHALVNSISIKEWRDSIYKSKHILEDIIGEEVKGYRSASWSLPFDKDYYEILIEEGYSYSSSYFPIKTYMYGNSIDKKRPFKISTNMGEITEYPILKNIIPYSGGFYLRAIPFIIEKYLLNNSIKQGYKPIIYIHPYELLDINLINYFRKKTSINLDFILAFYSTSSPLKKIEKLLYD